MIRENLVSASITNGAECICNPEVLFGTKFGLWDFKNEVAPRGTLLDLNAAWELFLSRQGLLNDVKFDEHYHHLHEVIDGVVYEDGDVTYTLMDDKGNKTNATFTVKANKGPVEHIEWEKGNLILYYTKTRPITPEDISSGVPIHYVYDESGQPVIDPETGKPLIYDYVKIPIIEIFDNHETHKLFPWYADDLHTIRPRQNLDEDELGHLGDVAITSDSEVFIAKEKFPGNVGNTLVSVQSVYELLKKDLGINPSYTDILDYIDEEGQSIHLRATGSDIESKLDTSDKSSIVKAINEIKLRVDKTHKLINASDSKTSDELLAFSNYILTHKTEWTNNTKNLVDALNYILDIEIGKFIEDIEVPEVSTITEALNSIYLEAEENKKRIGYLNNKWITLNTDKNENLTEAINEVDEHTNALADIVKVREKYNAVTKKTYYDNPYLNDITKGRLRPGIPTKDDTSIIENINELLNLIGNLSKNASGVNLVELTTDAKDTIVNSINEVDLNTDNNSLVIGAEYNKNVEGKKSGDITNLTTTNKNTLVEAINELDSRAGELENLDTNTKENIVSAINEVIEHSPIVYEDILDLENSGIKLKNSENISGEKSLVVGKNNSSAKYSLVSGLENISLGDYSIVSGRKNTSRKNYNQISGELNTSNGVYNNISGKSNNVVGDNNTINGTSNNINSNGSLVIGDNNISEELLNNITALGDSNTFKAGETNALGSNNILNGENSTVAGKNNSVGKDSAVLGNGNELKGESNFSFGKDNYIEGDYSTSLGKYNNTKGNNDFLIGENNSSEGNHNYIIGEGLSLENSNSNIIIGSQSKNYKNINNAIILGEINTPHSDSTHIGRDIYIQTHDTESKLQSLIFVDLNDWCRLNNASSLNGGKFLDSSHLVHALKIYLERDYTDNALIRFKMQDENENGFIIVLGKSKRIYVNGTWYFSDNIENGWSRHEGTYLKVIKQTETDGQGNSVTKHYLAFMDQLSTEAFVDTIGALRSDTEDYKDINLTHAYGAVDIDDFDKALDLVNRLNKKVDKSAQIITKYHNADGTITEKSQNFVGETPNQSGDIVLDLEENFGFNPDSYLLKGEKGEPNGYVPLNAGGLIDSLYLPSFVDDVIEVWAEYQVDSATGAIFDIHLYKLESSIVPSTGEEIYTKGAEILEGELGKIYIEANPSSERRFAALFRWSGRLFTAIGFTNIVIGEVTGTAYDGGKGKALRDDFDDHKKSGITQIPVENPDGTITWVTYKPNPHNVTPQQLDIAINDPNDPQNIELEDPFIRDYNVATALQTLFDRLNKIEDTSDSISAIIGTLEEIAELEETEKSIIGLLLDTTEKINSFLPTLSQNILDIVANNLLFYGES